MTTLVSANIDWATGADKDRDQLNHLLGLINEDPEGKGALMLQEAKNLIGQHPLKDLLPHQNPPHLVRVFHRESDAAVAGTAIVTVGLPMTGKRLFLGGDTPDTLPRWVARADIRPPKGKHHILFSAHVPPARAGREAQDAYLHVVAKRTRGLSRLGQEWSLGTDGNMPIEDVAKIIGGTPYGEGIVGIISTAKVLDHGIDRYGLKQGDTDHPAPWIKI